MELDALTAGLHSPLVAWNTSKRHIVERMTEFECRAIAKRTTSNLRDRSPEIRRFIQNRSNTRLKFAKLLFTQELVKANQLTEEEVTQYKRMARIADAQVKHHDNIVVFFQNESGYRVCCLSYIANDFCLESSLQLLKDMESLSGLQTTLDQAILLDDLLGILIKRASKYPEFDAAGQKAKYEAVLVSYTAEIRRVLENCSWSDTDPKIADYLNKQHAQQPHLTDSTYAAMLAFALARECYELLSQYIFEQIAIEVAPVISRHPEFMLQTE